MVRSNCNHVGDHSEKLQNGHGPCVTPRRTIYEKKRKMVQVHVYGVVQRGHNHRHQIQMKIPKMVKVAQMFEKLKKRKNHIILVLQATPEFRGNGRSTISMEFK